MMPTAPPTVPGSVAPVARTARRIAVATPQLSVVIVNYRQWGNTARLTRQLLAAESARCGIAEVVIVDNCSPAHFVRKSLRRTPGVSVRCFRQNRGFARGVNEACRLSRGDWFLLLNPDVALESGFLDSVLELAERVRADDPR